MTLLGKIFTVMIFMMSLLFMAFSLMVYATHKNWKEVVTADDGLKSQNEAKQVIITELRQELNESVNSLARERAARRSALSSLESKLSQSAQLVTQKQQELDALNVAHGLTVQELKSSQDLLTALTDQVDKLWVDIRNARADRDEKYARSIALQDQVYVLESAKRNLEERRDQLIAQVGRYKGVLDRRGLSVDTPIDLVAPMLDGYVTAVANSDYIEVSIGGDDGLLPGHEMHVFRDRTYLGKVIIKKVSPNRAVAQVIKETARGIIKKGDRVATKLS